MTVFLRWMRASRRWTGSAEKRQWSLVQREGSVVAPPNFSTNWGARVIAVDIDSSALDAAFGHGSVTPCVADVADDGLDKAAALTAEHGPVELLVNNVGIDTEHRFLDLGEHDYDRVFGANLRGPWFLTRGIAKSMVQARRRGAIVFVSSLHDTFVRTFPHYSASKAAVAMLVKELAVELGPHGIRVNAVSPGVIHTAHVPAPPDQAEVERLGALIPLGDMGEPLDVARPIAMLLSDQWSGYITGANVRVDGGLGAHSWSLDPAPGGN
jgi:NAD(P)-dependent dehydrogenase (short-subunit alcohol dehydrogenase family)